MSMTPVMDDMMNSCGDLAGASVNSLSSILAASFSLGQMVRAPTSRPSGWETFLHAQAMSSARSTAAAIIPQPRGQLAPILTTSHPPLRLALYLAQRSPRASPSLMRAPSWPWCCCCTPRPSC
jgi:hypothetical protein